MGGWLGTGISGGAPAPFDFTLKGVVNSLKAPMRHGVFWPNRHVQQKKYF
jgi:hypothetical protein